MSVLSKEVRSTKRKINLLGLVDVLLSFWHGSRETREHSSYRNKIMQPSSTRNGLQERWRGTFDKDMW